MTPQTGLSEDDFKVEGHCCAIILPAVKELEEGIDFHADDAVKAYFQDKYGVKDQDKTADSAIIQA